MPDCTACGAHVSTDYHRVFADNDGVLRECPTCGRRAAASGGA